MAVLDWTIALTGSVLLALPWLPIVQPPLHRLLCRGWRNSFVACSIGVAGQQPRRRTRRAVPVDVGVLVGMAYCFPLAIRAEPPSILDVGLGVVLLALTLFDLRWRLLPDGLTLPLLIAAVPIMMVTTGGVAVGALTAAVTYAAGSAIAAGFWRLRGVHGLGGGDLKLMAALAFWLGPAGTPVAIVIAALSALAVEALIAIRAGRLDRRRLIPFGAYLAGAFWVLWCLPGILKI